MAGLSWKAEVYLEVISSLLQHLTESNLSRKTQVSIVNSTLTLVNNKQYVCHVVENIHDWISSQSQTQSVLQETYFRTHDENEEDEEDKGGEVDGSQDWAGLLYLRELKVSQDNTELGETTWERTDGKTFH